MHVIAPTTVFGALVLAAPNEAANVTTGGPTSCPRDAAVVRTAKDPSLEPSRPRCAVNVCCPIMTNRLPMPVVVAARTSIQSSLAQQRSTGPVTKTATPSSATLAPPIRSESRPTGSAATSAGAAKEAATRPSANPVAPSSTAL